MPFGKIAVSIAMWPCSTRVKLRFSSAEGVPKCCSGHHRECETLVYSAKRTKVRVTSVVPSEYCAVNQTRVGS